MISDHPNVICIAGFGDDSNMFAPLLGTTLARQCNLILLDLPGFGVGAPLKKTTLQTLGTFVHEHAVQSNAQVIIAHSVASIIASLVAKRPNNAVSTVISLEGNLTAADAYFSGSAAAYDDPDAFKAAFLARLAKMARTDPVIARYRSRVKQADPFWRSGNWVVTRTHFPRHRCLVKF